MATKAAEAAAPAAPVPEIQISGTGKFYYPSGATYDGEWKLLNPPLPPPPEDPKEKKKKPAKDEPPPPPPEPPKRVRHGRGVYREGDYMYDGEFFEDVITGYGTFRYASGSTYSGEWKSGKYHGKGTYTWPDGRRYDGMWEENRMHGHGVYTDASGHKWEGQFYNGSGPGLTCQL